MIHLRRIKITIHAWTLIGAIDAKARGKYQPLILNHTLEQTISRVLCVTETHVEASLLVRD